MIEKDITDFGEQTLEVYDRGHEERELVTIGLLMRIYDLQLALLKHFNEDEAIKVYEEHAKGGNFNPAMFIPQFKEDDGENQEA